MKSKLLAALFGLLVTVAAAYADGTAATKIGKTLAESVPGSAPESPVAKGAPNVIRILLDDVGYAARAAPSAAGRARPCWTAWSGTG